MKTRITLDDCRAVPSFGKKSGYCARGMRLWAEQNKLDFKDFLKNGIEIEKLRATNDPLALNIIEYVEKKNPHSGG